MPITGPIYAGDVNTLATLSLKRQIAQQQATQNAISGATRSIGNLVQGKNQRDAIQGRQVQNDENYAFREVMDANAKGLYTAEQLEGLEKSFSNPIHRDSIRGAASSIREMESDIEQEAPVALNRLNTALAPIQQAIADAEEEKERLANALIVWGGNRTGKIKEQDDRIRIQQQQAAQLLQQFDESDPRMANRFVTDQYGRVVDTRAGQGGGGSRPGSSPSSAASAGALPPPSSQSSAGGIPDFAVDVLGQGQQQPAQPQPAPPQAAPAPAPVAQPAGAAAVNVLPPPAAAAPAPAAQPAYNPPLLLTNQQPIVMQPPTQTYDSNRIPTTVTGPVVDPYAGFNLRSNAANVPVQNAGALPTSPQPLPPTVSNNIPVGAGMNVGGGQVQKDPATGQIRFTDDQGNPVSAQDLLGPEILAAMYRRIDYLVTQGKPLDQAEAEAGIWAMQQQTQQQLGN